MAWYNGLIQAWYHVLILAWYLGLILDWYHGSILAWHYGLILVWYLVLLPAWHYGLVSCFATGLALLIWFDNGMTRRNMMPNSLNNKPTYIHIITIYNNM